MAGAQLLGLQHEVNIVGRQALAHPLGTMTDHHVDLARRKRAGGVDDVAEHGLAGHLVQDLGRAERMRVLWPAARMTISRDIKADPVTVLPECEPMEGRR